MVTTINTNNKCILLEFETKSIFLLNNEEKKSSKIVYP